MLNKYNKKYIIKNIYKDMDDLEQESQNDGKKK